MAEVVGALANAASSIAIAAAVGAVVGLIYMIWGQLFQFIPYAGSVLFGSLFTLVFNEMDPFLGMGLGLGMGMMSYIPLKIFVASLYPTTKNTMPSGLQMANAMKGVSQALCGGAALGFAHAATKSIPFALACGAAGVYLGGRYAWTPITNFFIAIGFFGPLNCDSKKPDLLQCVQACTGKIEKAVAAAVKAAPPCLNNQDPYVHDWCDRKAAYVSQCAWDNTLADPGVPPVSGGQRTPAADQRCQSYKAWVQPGQYPFDAICQPSAALEAFAKTFGDTLTMYPLTKAEYDSYYGEGAEQGYKRMDYDFAKDVNGNIIAGRIRMLDWEKGPLDTSYMTSDSPGSLNAIPANGDFVCVWVLTNGSWHWWFIEPNGVPTGAPPNMPNINYTVFDMSKAPGWLSTTWKNRQACVPTLLSAADDKLLPQWQLDVQPIDADRPLFCASYDKASKKAGSGVSRIFPSYPNQEFQCFVGPGSIEPSYGLPWPK